jgi:hypothetical protein
MASSDNPPRQKFTGPRDPGYLPSARHRSYSLGTRQFETVSSDPHNNRAKKTALTVKPIAITTRPRISRPTRLATPAAP